MSPHVMDRPAKPKKRDRSPGPGKEQAPTAPAPLSTPKEPAPPQIEVKVTRPKRPRVTAESLATKQRDISVSEFFAKNRHLLGFDNPRKALLTAVKEAVDNSLDACEEASILPDVTVVIEDLNPDRPSTAKSSRYRITIVDNGPGIIRQQVEHIFGRLLYGSKFHRLKMSRGQQGIGISAAGMYGLITTGKPMVIQTRPKPRKPAHHIELAINTKTNRAEVTTDVETDDFPLRKVRDLGAAALRSGRVDPPPGYVFLDPECYPTGTSVTIELEGKYQRGRGSVDEFLELTAIANPHAQFTFVRPTRETQEEEEPLLRRAPPPPPPPPPAGEVPESSRAEGASDESPTAAATQDLGPVVLYPRAVSELPPETREIQPHPRGVELGTLLQMLKDYEASKKGGTLYQFLKDRFCRVSSATASGFCEKIGVTARTRAGDIEPPQAEALYKVFQDAKLAPPPTDCLAPIGVRQLLAGLLKGVRAEFYAASSRDPAVYRGRPFQVEAAVAFGGELTADEPARVIRFANRVPLLYQQSACSSFKAVVDTKWRNYDLQHPRDSLPIGPLVIMIHMASVWVPFTSESKEAIADYDEIRKEMRLALMECGRKLGAYINKRARMRRESDRRDIFERYIGEVASACNAITGADAKELYEALLRQAKRRTAVADVTLDEEGKVVKESESLGKDDGVVIIPTAVAPPSSPPGGGEVAAATEVGALSTTASSSSTTGRTSKRAANPRPTGDGRESSKLKVQSSKPSPPAPPLRPHKRKMRLVNGKLEPIDDSPGLF